MYNNKRKYLFSRNCKSNIQIFTLLSTGYLKVFTFNSLEMYVLMP